MVSYHKISYNIMYFSVRSGCFLQSRVSFNTIQATLQDCQIGTIAHEASNIVTTVVGQTKSDDCTNLLYSTKVNCRSLQRELRQSTNS
jgi:hypothetical protein